MTDLFVAALIAFYTQVATVLKEYLLTVNLVKSAFFSLILFFYSEAGITSSANPPLAFLNIDVDKNSVTLKAKSTSLQEILDAFAKTSNIKINSAYRLTQTLDIAVNKKPTQVFIKQILQGYNYVIFFKKPMPGYAQSSIEQINIYGGPAKPKSQPTQTSNLPNDDSNLDEPFPSEGINQRLELIDSLEIKSDVEAIKALNKLYSTEQNLLVKQSIIEALGKRQGLEIVDALANALSDESPIIRTSITEALMNQQHSQAHLILAQILFGDPDPEIRAIAAEALAASNSEHIQSFFETAQNDRDERVKLAVTLDQFEPTKQ